MKALVIHAEYAPRIGIVRALRRAEATVYATDNTDEGLCILRNELPDVIVTDFYLNDRNVFEFYEQVKPILFANSLRLIIVSDLRLTSLERQDARILGIPVYFLATFSAKELINSDFRK